MTPAARAQLRRAAGVAALLLLPLGLWLAARQQVRLTWLNSGVSIQYPSAAGLLAALAGAGACAAAALLPRRARPWLLLLGVLALGYALSLVRYRVTIEDAGIGERGLLGSRVLPWKEVARVESGSARVIVWFQDEDQVRIDASAFAGEDRARLDRTLARRIRENASTRP